MVYAPRRPRGIAKVCHYCQAAPPATVDHIVPQALGGANAGWNMVGACQACNNTKGSDWPTCTCEKCSAAVERFMCDESLRRRAVEKLRNRVGHLTEGIQAKLLEIERLENRRAATLAIVALLDTD